MTSIFHNDKIDRIMKDVCEIVRRYVFEICADNPNIPKALYFVFLFGSTLWNVVWYKGRLHYEEGENETL